MTDLAARRTTTLQGDLEAAERAQRRLETLTDSAMWQAILPALPDELRAELRTAQAAHIAAMLESGETLMALQAQARAWADGPRYAYLRSTYDAQAARADETYAVYADVAARVREIMRTVLERQWNKSRPALESARKEVFALRKQLEAIRLREAAQQEEARQEAAQLRDHANRLRAEIEALQRMEAERLEAERLDAAEIETLRILGLVK